MLPILEGVIARRLLVNFRVSPEVAQGLLPEPLEAQTQNGFAVAGICLIRLEQLRPKGLPAALGLSSENMAHRIAVRYPQGEGRHEGVFIWRRETDQCLVSLLGGRLFPGVHHPAAFTVADTGDCIRMHITTEQGASDVTLTAEPADEWTPTPLFATLEDASAFFEKGDCGFSCGLHDKALEGMQLKTQYWNAHPLKIQSLNTAFFENAARFPPNSLAFDSALLMRGIPHEWHELDKMPLVRYNTANHDTKT